MPSPHLPETPAPPQGWVLTDSVGRCCASPACQHLISLFLCLSTHLGWESLQVRLCAEFRGTGRGWHLSPRKLTAHCMREERPEITRPSLRAQVKYQHPLPRRHPWGWSVCLGMSVLSKSCVPQNQASWPALPDTTPHASGKPLYLRHDTILDSCLLSPHTVDPQGWSIRLMSMLLGKLRCWQGGWDCRMGRETSGSLWEQLKVLSLGNRETQEGTAVVF